MFEYKREDKKNKTVAFTVTVKSADVKKRQEQALKDLAKTTSIEGFRKGTAPVEIARKNIPKEKVYDKLIQDLLPDIYKEILTKEKLQPMISPHVELKSAKENKDWVVEMQIALKPEVTLPDYQKIVKEAKGDMKKDDIWVPGKSESAEPSEEQMKKREQMLNVAVDNIIKGTKIEISDLIVDQEVNTRLSRLIDDVGKIGLTIDAYLQSKNLTQEKLKEQFKTDTLNTYKLELALSEIGDKENITVTKEEMDKLLGSIQSEEEKKAAEQNMYVYSSMLRKQKIIDFLAGL